jgi:hypothetical protein
LQVVVAHDLHHLHAAVREVARDILQAAVPGQRIRTGVGREHQDGRGVLRRVDRDLMPLGIGKDEGRRGVTGGLPGP